MDNTESLLDLVDGLLTKSEEAYLMSLEIINKPTINYRTEGFCFFICNAWELLLKAFLIDKYQKIDTIYYNDGSNRTIGLDQCVEKVFTSTTDKTKLNITMVRRIRNTATHSVLPEFDYEFSSVFQRCLTNYNNFFKNHFKGYGLNDKVTAFVSLSRIHNNDDSRLSLDPKSAIEFERLKSMVDGDDGIGQRITLTSIKNKSDADLTFAIDKESSDSSKFIEVPKDVNAMYKYSFKEALNLVKESIALELGVDHGFNVSSFHSICKLKGIKEDNKYCYNFNYGKSNARKYNDDAIEYLAYLFTSDKQLREMTRKKNQ